MMLDNYVMIISHNVMMIHVLNYVAMILCHYTLFFNIWRRIFAPEIIQKWGITSILLSSLFYSSFVFLTFLIEKSKVGGNPVIYNINK